MSYISGFSLDLGMQEQESCKNERVNSSQTLVWFSLLWDFRPLCSVNFLRLAVGVSTSIVYLYLYRLPLTLSFCYPTKLRNLFG